MPGDLQTMATTILAEAKNPGHARPHLLITMTAETFTTVRDHLRAAGETTRVGGGSSTSAGSGSSPGAGAAFGLTGASATCGDNRPAPVVRYQDGPLLPLTELGRTLCDSQIARLVIGANSEPLDLGRSERLFTPAQRRAVIARDQGCAWDGCTMPARFCEVHHIDWYDEDHGHTTTRRGVLVCPFHHHELHRHKLDLIRNDPPELNLHGTGLPEPRHTDAPDPPPGRDATAVLPGDPDYQRVTYRRVPRAHTRAQREEGRRARLLADVRTESTARKARRRVS